MFGLNICFIFAWIQSLYQMQHFMPFYHIFDQKLESNSSWGFFLHGTVPVSKILRHLVHSLPNYEVYCKFLKYTVLIQKKKQFSFSNRIFLKLNFFRYYKYMLVNVTAIQVQDMQHLRLHYSKYAAKFKFVLQRQRNIAMTKLCHLIICIASDVFHQ